MLIVHLIDNPYAMPVSSSGYHPQSQPYGGGGGVPFYNPYSLHPPPEMAYMMQGPPMNMNMNMKKLISQRFKSFEVKIKFKLISKYGKVILCGWDVRIVKANS